MVIPSKLFDGIFRTTFSLQLTSLPGDLVVVPMEDLTLFSSKISRKNKARISSSKSSFATIESLAYNGAIMKQLSCKLGLIAPYPAILPPRKATRNVTSGWIKVISRSSDDHTNEVLHQMTVMRKLIVY